MEHKPNSHIPVGLFNDQKYQSTPQNGAILLAKLQQKVARLEISLRDKESELVKLTSSSKASYVNELKIQTEVYYQEVLRLKNQLNRLQETKIQSQISSTNERNEKKSPKKSTKDAEAQAQTVDKALLRSIEKLKEENENLNTKLSLIQADKERLSAEYKNLVLQMKEQDSNKVAVEENTTQTSPRTESLPSPKKQITDETLNILKVQIEELQSKEKSWEEERATYKELVLNLKEDRVFFKDTSQKRHDELWDLQKELVKLQKEIGGFHLNGKPLCKQCIKPSYRTTKLTRKILVKDMATTTTPRHSQDGSNSTSTEKSSKSKNSVSGSPKRLPTPLKTFQKESSHSHVSKSPSSTTSSGSSSAQPSPSHSSMKKPPKPLTKSSSIRTSSSVEKSQPEKLSSRTTSSSSMSVDDPNTSSSKKILRSGSLTSPKRIISQSSNSSSPSKSTQNAGVLTSPSKRTPHHSQISSPLRGKPEIAQQRRERQSSASSNASVNSCGPSTPTVEATETTAKVFEDDGEHDEDIALEILQNLDTMNLSDSNNTNDKILDDHKNNDTGLPSSRSSQTLEEDADPRIPDSGGQSQEESGCGDSQEIDQLEDSYSEKVSESSLNTLVCLLESHMCRKKMLVEWKALSKQSPPSQMHSSPSSVAKSTPSKKSPDSKAKLKASIAYKSSIAKGSPKSPVKFSPKATRSTPKKSPPKLQRESRTVSENYTGGEGENMKDIDKMICLLEGHIARKAILSLHAEK